MGTFNHANAKIMITALFFEYLAYAFFGIYDNLKDSGPVYVYVNQQAREIEERNAKNRAEQKKKEEEEKKKKKEQEKKEKEDKKKGDKNAPEEVKKAEEIAKKKEEEKQREQRMKNQNQPAGNPGDIGHDYDIWESKNRDSITKIVVNFFPKYFLFYVLCVGFCASRAPTDFAVGLTYSEVLVRVVQVYAYYYNNKIVTIGCIGVGAAINFLLIFTGLIHKY